MQGFLSMFRQGDYGQCGEPSCPYNARLCAWGYCWQCCKEKHKSHIAGEEAAAGERWILKQHAHKTEKATPKEERPPELGTLVKEESVFYPETPAYLFDKEKTVLDSPEFQAAEQLALASTCATSP